MKASTFIDIGTGRGTYLCPEISQTPQKTVPYSSQAILPDKPAMFSGIIGPAFLSVMTTI